MSENSIYGSCRDTLPRVLEDLMQQLRDWNEQEKRDHGHPVFEHLTGRVKSEESMREKCLRKGLPQTPESALQELNDAVGIRVITRFADDIRRVVLYLRGMEGCRVIQEKDYLTRAKPNGYRSYHMILELTVPYADLTGTDPGTYRAEVQLRTIAMDSWASLEHELKYKQNIRNQELITAELKRCADELASCDLSMQTIRDLIRADEEI